MKPGVCELTLLVIHNYVLPIHVWCWNNAVHGFGTAAQILLATCTYYVQVFHISRVSEVHAYDLYFFDSQKFWFHIQYVRMSFQGNTSIAVVNRGH